MLYTDISIYHQSYVRNTHNLSCMRDTKSVRPDPFSCASWGLTSFNPSNFTILSHETLPRLACSLTVSGPGSASVLENSSSETHPRNPMSWKIALAISMTGRYPPRSCSRGNSLAFRDQFMRAGCPGTWNGWCTSSGARSRSPSTSWT